MRHSIKPKKILGTQIPIHARFIHAKNWWNITNPGSYSIFKDACYWSGGRVGRCNGRRMLFILAHKLYSKRWSIQIWSVWFLLNRFKGLESLEGSVPTCYNAYDSYWKGGNIVFAVTNLRQNCCEGRSHPSSTFESCIPEQITAVRSRTDHHSIVWSPPPYITVKHSGGSADWTASAVMTRALRHVGHVRSNSCSPHS